MAKIKGIDVSHWNSRRTIETADGAEFAIIKLTEGKTYVDTMAAHHYESAKARRMLTGFYHYARAERNNSRDEAAHFVTQLEKIGWARGETMLVLDFEQKSLSITNVDTWAVQFLEEVYRLTGVKPLLYVSQSVVKRFKKVCAAGFGLWVARYRNPAFGYGNVSPWKFAAMWQYTNNVVDQNVFYGNRSQFLKYCEVI